MPTRLLREGILSSPKISRLSERAENFYRRLMSVVDDYGRYYGSSAHLRPAVYPSLIEDDSPYQRHYDDAMVSESLGECVRENLIRIYKVNGTRYLEIQNFGQQQRSKPKFPAPPGGAEAKNADGKQSVIRLITDSEATENGPRSLDEDEDEIEGGDGKGSSSPSSEHSETEPKYSADDLKKRINPWFGIPRDTDWSVIQMSLVIDYLHWPAENWDSLEAYYTAPRPTRPRAEDPDNPLHYRRQSIKALLENLPDELGKAIQWDKSRPTPGRATSAPDPLDHPPAGDWRALADELYERPDVTAGRQWPDLDRDVRSEIHEFAAKKNREKKTGENAA